MQLKSTVIRTLLLGWFCAALVHGQASQPDHRRGVFLQLVEGVLGVLDLGEPLVQPPDPGLGRVPGGPDLLLSLLGAGQDARRGLCRRVHGVSLAGVQAGQVVGGRRGPQRGQPGGPPAHLLVQGRLVFRAEQRGAGQLHGGEAAVRLPVTGLDLRAEDFGKCWPNCEKIRAFHIEKLFAKGDEAFVLYELEPNVGPRFRNTEFFRMKGNKIREVEVYFGSHVGTVGRDE